MTPPGWSKSIPENALLIRSPSRGIARSSGGQTKAALARFFTDASVTEFGAKAKAPLEGAPGNTAVQVASVLVLLLLRLARTRLWEAPNSLLAGNLQGISSTLASVAQICRQNSYYNQWLMSKFPTRRNRELIGPYQGIKSAYQGNFLLDQGRALG